MSIESLPDNYDWFSDQIAGHHPSVIKNGKREIGILKQSGSDTVLKPKQDARRGECEDTVYSMLAGRLRNGTSDSEKKEKDSWASVLPADVDGLAALTPRFHGLQNLCVDGEFHDFLVLEDVSASYCQPAILDVKMGRVTYDPLANEAKREKESGKYPPQKTLGFRILGYRVHRDGAVESRDKDWGKSHDESNIQEGLREFFHGGRGNDAELREGILSRLREILSWFESQKSFHFYASSLLFLYETDPKRRPDVKIYMIDFSHVFPANGTNDENYLPGLRNLIAHIQDL